MNEKQKRFQRKAQIAFGKDGFGRFYEDLRIQFSVEKSREATPNKATIKVTNLSKDTRSQMEASDLSVLLSAGYENDLGTIFIGNLALSLTDFSGTDAITTLEAGDGEKPYRNATIDKSYSAGFDIKQIITEVITSFGVKAFNTDAVKSVKTLNGVTLSGRSRDQLTKLLAAQNLEWSFQDGVIQIIKSDGSSQLEKVLLNSESGLIGSPRKKEKGIEVQSLLLPRLKPGQLVEMDSLDVKGTYVVSRLTHTGDTHGSEWTTSFEATPEGNT